MNILIVCQYYYPEQFLINQIAPELVRRGHKVTVLTGLPNYPTGIVPDEYKHGKHRKEIIDEVEVIRCQEHGRKGGLVHLFLNYLSFIYYGIKATKSLSFSYDIVFCYQLSPITMLKPAIAYKKMYGVPIFNYCLDLWPESVQAYLSAKNPLYKLVSLYCKKLYQACDRIAVTSQPFIDYLHVVNGISKEKLCYIPQHADGSMLNMDLSRENTGVIKFLFAGNLGKGQKIETIIKAVAFLKNRKDFEVHMVGDGTMRLNLEALAHNLGVSDKLIFHGTQKREDMPKFYAMADALLITLRGNNAVGDTMPGKLQTYMTTGKPILGAINGAAKIVIEESKCGSCVKAEDAKGLAEIMEDFIKNPEKYSSCGQNAKFYFQKHFTFSIFMDSLEKELKSLV